MTFGSLFSGISGVDLGLERAGMECRWQVEIDGFCRKVLMKHWPEVPKYGDIRELTGEELERVDLICGGFPCQDISAASATATGIVGARSALWSEFKRLVGEVQPLFVLVENVPALRTRGLALVLQDLWEVGYDAEWHCIPASAFGAHHERDRVWIVGYARDYANGHIIRRHGRTGLLGTEGRAESQISGSVANPDGEPLVRAAIARGERHTWTIEPGVVRMVYGVPDRVDRIKALGNAVVPQVAEWIGQQIMRANSRGS